MIYVEWFIKIDIIVIYSYRRRYINFYRINHVADEGGVERVGQGRRERKVGGKGVGRGDGGLIVKIRMIIWQFSNGLSKYKPSQQKMLQFSHFGKNNNLKDEFKKGFH